MWLTASQEGEVWSPFLGPWGLFRSEKTPLSSGQKSPLTLIPMLMGTWVPSPAGFSQQQTSKEHICSLKILPCISQIPCTLKQKLIKWASSKKLTSVYTPLADCWLAFYFCSEGSIILICINSTRRYSYRIWLQNIVSPFKLQLLYVTIFNAWLLHSLYTTTDRHNLRISLAANSTQNYFLIARMLRFLWHSRQKCGI